MKYEDLDQDMKSIIQECQADFIRDSNERFEVLADKKSAFQNGTITKEDFLDTILKQVHAMKGVARTIYYEVFHKKSEQLIFYIREHQESSWTSIDLNYVHDEVNSLKKELDFCKVYD